MIDAAVEAGAGGRTEATAWLSSLVGALVLARAVAGADDALAATLLRAQRTRSARGP